MPKACFTSRFGGEEVRRRRPEELRLSNRKLNHEKRLERREWCMRITAIVYNSLAK
jgi:hypothetical protein